VTFPCLNMDSPGPGGYTAPLNVILMLKFDFGCFSLWLEVASWWLPTFSFVTCVYIIVDLD